MVELLLPVNIYWEVEDLLKKVDYLLSTHEDPVLINEHYQKVLRKVASYVVSERDRLKLQDRLNAGSP